MSGCEPKPVVVCPRNLSLATVVCIELVSAYQGPEIALVIIEDAAEILLRYAPKPISKFELHRTPRRLCTIGLHAP